MNVVALALFGVTSATLFAQKEPDRQKRELDEMLSAVMPFAKQMLEKHGEFYPYGASMSTEGKISSVGGYTGSEHPKSTELIDMLKSAFRRDANAGKIRACAVVYDIRVVPPGQTQRTDAVKVDLDHRDGASIVVVYPYVIAPDKSVAFGQSFAEKGKNTIFQAVPEPGPESRAEHP